MTHAPDQDRENALRDAIASGETDPDSTTGQERVGAAAGGAGGGENSAAARSASDGRTTTSKDSTTSAGSHGKTTTPETAAHKPKPHWVAMLQRRETRLSIAVMLLLSALFSQDWDGFVFTTAVHQLWHGHTPYEIAAGQPWYAFLDSGDTGTQWYAYPPLPLLAMAVTDLPGVLFHLPAFLERVLVKLPWVFSTVALAAVGGAWARRLGSTEEDAQKVERRFLWSIYLILVGAAWGMTDTALMALYMGGILAYRNGKPGKAGVLVALAALVKPFPALLVIPILPYLLRHHGWRSLWRFVRAGAATAIPIVLPFAIVSWRGLWQQAVNMHLTRPPQGATPWTLWPLTLVPHSVVPAASLVLMGITLLALGWLASRLDGRGTALILTLLAGIAVLFWNRVLNEQYLVLVVAPLLVLDQGHALDKFGHFLTIWSPSLFAAFIVLGGFHFLTFIPPDEALPLFGRSVDGVAEAMRNAMPGFWPVIQKTLEILVPITLVALAVLGLRVVARLRKAASPRRVVRHMLPPVAACGLLILMGIAPAIAGPAHAPVNAFAPATDAPRVSAFYYLWWHNPGHDPNVQYGNWGPVSQTPQRGYYTFNRGVARDDARAMVAAGIDTAIVSYHRGELDRYRVFQEEANNAGLRVAPLVELNQVYDNPLHHPVDADGRLDDFAGYRLDAATQAAIEQFTLDLKDQLAKPSTLRMDGKPVVYYYDSYISVAGFDPVDKHDLAQVLLDIAPLDALRTAFNDSAMPPTVDGLVAHYPANYKAFFEQGSNALWRAAHLEQHRRFWAGVRAHLEAQLGPLFLVSGEAFNERAGFQTGTVKGVLDAELFDGLFVYSPSFTWGTMRDVPFATVFRAWEDRNRWLEAYAAGQGKASILGLAPAYDDTVNRPNGFVIPDTVGNASRATSFYSLAWASADQRPPTIGAVATWNEFFEGSGIEPTVEDGHRFYDATPGHAADFAAATHRAAATAPRIVLTHESESRTHIGRSESDLAHAAGLGLIAAAQRTGGGDVAALDGLARHVGVTQTPSALLLDGGDVAYAVSPQVVEALAKWRQEGVPTIVFGASIAPDLQHLAGDCQVPAAPAGDSTLQPGDRLEARTGSLVLVRAGVESTVGVRCAIPGVAVTSLKPWTNGGTGSPECLEVALAALAPATYVAESTPASTSCVVASHESLEELQESLIGRVA